MRDEYVRALYAAILSGWVSKRQLAAAILIANAIDFGIMLFLASQRGPLVIAFALAGLFISVFYVAPPIRLKHIGLGEPGVFIVWRTADGGRHLLRGHRPAARLGLAGVAAVRDPGDDRALRKHIDKIEADAAKGIRTLPVILGEARARHGPGLIAFYPIAIGAALVGFIGPWVALVLLGICAWFRCWPCSPSRSPAGAAPSVELVGSAVVRGRRLRAHQARRGAADPGTPAEHDLPDPRALGLTLSRHATCT